MNEEVNRIIHKLKSSIGTYNGFASYVNEKAAAKQSADEKDLKDYCGAAARSSRTAGELIERLEKLLS